MGWREQVEQDDQLTPCGVSWSSTYGWHALKWHCGSHLWNKVTFPEISLTTDDFFRKGQSWRCAVDLVLPNNQCRTKTSHPEKVLFDRCVHILLSSAMCLGHIVLIMNIPVRKCLVLLRQRPLFPRAKGQGIWDSWAAPPNNYFIIFQGKTLSWYHLHTSSLGNVGITFIQHHVNQTHYPRYIIISSKTQSYRSIMANFLSTTMIHSDFNFNPSCKLLDLSDVDVPF